MPIDKIYPCNTQESPGDAKTWAFSIISDCFEIHLQSSVIQTELLTKQYMSKKYFKRE